jgi:uncharacterized protein (TIGR01615 family)
MELMFGVSAAQLCSLVAAQPEPARGRVDTAQDNSQIDYAQWSNGAVLARLVEPHVSPRNDFEAGLLEAVRRLKAGGALIEAARLTAHLAGLGYAARAVQAGRSSSTTLSLKHTFVAVEYAEEDGRLMELIVEPHLRSHFQISRPSILYSRLVDDLPDEFVGCGDRLSRLCCFVADQMGTSFQLNGMTSPPWRNVQSLLTKWNLGSGGHDRSPERVRAKPAHAARPPTFARRSVDGARTTAVAEAAAQPQCGTAPMPVPWVAR